MQYACLLKCFLSSCQFRYYATKNHNLLDVEVCTQGRVVSWGRGPGKSQQRGGCGVSSARAGAGAGTGDWGGSGGSRTSGVQTAAAATHSSSRALVCRDGAWWAVAYIKTSSNQTSTKNCIQCGETFKQKQLIDITQNFETPVFKKLIGICHHSFISE